MKKRVRQRTRKHRKRGGSTLSMRKDSSMRKDLAIKTDLKEKLEKFISKEKYDSICHRVFAIVFYTICYVFSKMMRENEEFKKYSIENSIENYKQFYTDETLTTINEDKIHQAVSINFKPVIKKNISKSNNNVSNNVSNTIIAQNGGVVDILVRTLLDMLTKITNFTFKTVVHTVRNIYHTYTDFTTPCNSLLTCLSILLLGISIINYTGFTHLTLPVTYINDSIIEICHQIFPNDFLNELFAQIKIVFDIVLIAYPIDLSKNVEWMISKIWNKKINGQMYNFIACKLQGIINSCEQNCNR